MKILWLLNMIPGAVRALDGTDDGCGMWVDHILRDISERDDCSLYILYPGLSRNGNISERICFREFEEGEPYIYLPQMEDLFLSALQQFRPDVIHIWGTEYGHTLAMLKAAQRAGCLARTVVSIQGLCSVIARHYCEGIPESVRSGFTFRDLVRLDNIRMQQKKFIRRGELERQALTMAPNVIGRTFWDRACTGQINPERKYYFCNETLRSAFYSDKWQYSSCRKHTVFASTYDYPVKGFHYLLEAVSIVRRKYPDVRICVTGDSYFDNSFDRMIRRQTYIAYLRRLTNRYHLMDSIDFLGRLSEKEMKQAFINAHVFVMPSTIENSSNSLGEAMLLGVPCVAADVGGTSDLLKENEGRLYPSSAPYLLAQHIQDIFDMGERAEQMGAAARVHAETTHNAAENLRTLLDIYKELAHTEELRHV